MKSSFLSYPVAVLALCLGTPLLAASSKHLSLTIPVDSFSEVQLEMPIGEMDVEVYDGDSIELEIDVTAKRRWLSLRRRSADDVELEQRDRGDSLYLGIPDDKLEQTWIVRLPADLALDIEVGVGDVQIDGFRNNLVMEMGVGSLEVNLADDNYSEIVAETGVGDALIRGFSHGTDNERSLLVGADAYYRGEGDHRIEIELGVGDARIRVRPAP